TARIDLNSTVGKADRNVDISFPSEPRHYPHRSQTCFGIGLFEGNRFGLRPGFSAQDEHPKTVIGGWFILFIVLEQARAEQTSLAFQSGHVFLVRAAEVGPRWGVCRRGFN